MSHDTLTLTADTSDVWRHHIAPEDGPAGFLIRTTLPENPDGVEVFLEQWAAGSEETPHFHPGDDMTVVIEGRMAVQFYRQTPQGLVKDGEPVVLEKGQTGYIKGGRIHDARYLEACKLVFVHSGPFDLTEA
ncbi:cupin domain-containing protein [Paludibacterium paludis]|uniref:Cupin domain-containing protein n=1 Tax=Paludibacterium paludis TaxID=1225769 RepID=A0A918U8S1_9NEIS|nr:cupin domain-containing protein [Paludibacterium paludis]GGY11246.1 hypothetical protein GCM10011289_12700 [Paludibacterium paludis]